MALQFSCYPLQSVIRFALGMPATLSYCYGTGIYEGLFDRKATNENQEPPALRLHTVSRKASEVCLDLISCVRSLYEVIMIGSHLSSAAGGGLQPDTVQPSLTMSNVGSYCPCQS